MSVFIERHYQKNTVFVNTHQAMHSYSINYHLCIYIYQSTIRQISTFVVVVVNISFVILSTLTSFFVYDIYIYFF